MIDPARVARELYGLDAVATPLPGERDLNFRLDAGGVRYVLKLHEPREDLALEDAVLEHLRSSPPCRASPARRARSTATPRGCCRGWTGARGPRPAGTW